MVSRIGSIFLKVLRLQRGKIAVPQEGTRFFRQSIYLYYSIPQQKKQALQQPFLGRQPVHGTEAAVLLPAENKTC